MGDVGRTKFLQNFFSVYIAYTRGCKFANFYFNPLNANPTKWSDTFKQFVRCV